MNSLLPISSVLSMMNAAKKFCETFAMGLLKVISQTATAQVTRREWSYVNGLKSSMRIAIILFVVQYCRTSGLIWRIFHDLSIGWKSGRFGPFVKLYLKITWSNKSLDTSIWLLQLAFLLNSILETMSVLPQTISYFAPAAKLILAQKHYNL